MGPVRRWNVSDLEALMPWLDWAFTGQKSTLKAAA